jgi:hydroxymethylpyrimidine pyrophosphatase-like HAD family hydrolase
MAAVERGAGQGVPPFRALACDYDGTLATHDRIAPATLEALRRARAAGVRLVLVTGRTLFELTRVCEPLDVFDAVVAENGAVLYFPADSAVRDEGPPPSLRLLAALDRRCVPFQVGRVIVATTHDHRDAVRAALAEAETPLALVANRAALMLLPAGISKGTGLVSALFALGVPADDVLAIGDAENDLALFDACGWSACPEDALPEVKRRVDWILPAGDGEGVRRAIDERILDSRLPPPRHGRHELQLGWTLATAEAVEIPSRDVNVLVQGDSLCGKSSLVGGLVERLATAHESVCMLDPEGDYEVLHGLPTARLIDVARREDWNLVVDALRTATPVIVDLTGVAHAAKAALAGSGLALIHRLRERTGIPHWTVLDEAHCLLHRDAGAFSEKIPLAARGFCLATYRASALHPAVVDAMDVFVIGRTTQPDELRFLERLVVERGLGDPLPAAMLAALPCGTFVILRHGAPAATFVPPPRLVRHVRHLTKYADHGVAPHHRFFFLDAGGAVLRAAASLGEFVGALGDLPATSLRHHAERGDFSRWVRDVINDRVLAARLAKLERRWCRGEVPDLREEARALVHDAVHRASAPCGPAAGRQE